MSKKIRSKKVLSESESEEEAFAPDTSEAVAGDGESAKENNADFAAKKKKSSRIYHTLLDSDDSDAADHLSQEGTFEMGSGPGTPGFKLKNLETSANPQRKHKSHNVNGEQIDSKEQGRSRRRRRREKEKTKKAIKQMKRMDKKHEEKVCCEKEDNC